MTPHPDEQARELIRSKAWQDADWPADEERLIAALLARVRADTFKYIADNLYEGMYSAEIKELEKKFDGQ